MKRMPLRAAKEVVEEHRRRLGATVAAGVQLVTREGEHAVLATLRLPDGSECALGVVYGDDFCVELAIAEPAAVRRALLAVRLELAADRPRRFRYRGPTGWRRVQRAEVDLWFPEDGDARTSELAVARARPGCVDGRMFRTSRGLDGILVATGAAIELELGDTRYVYAIRAQIDPRFVARDHDSLEQLVESIEPIPQPTPAPAWSDAA